MRRIRRGRDELRMVLMVLTVSIVTFRNLDDLGADIMEFIQYFGAILGIVSFVLLVLHKMKWWD